MTAAKARSAKSVARLAGALAVIVGSMVLVGWAFDINALKSILPGWVSVKPNTALAFVLMGIASLFSSQPSTFLSRLARFCGWLAGLIGLLTLSEYVGGWNPGFDQWLFREPAGTVGTSNPGRMAPDSALCFMLLAAGLEIARASRERKRKLIATAVLGGLVTTLALAAMLAYFTPAIGAYGWWGLTIMAVPKAVVFAVLGAAIILNARQENVSFWAIGRKNTAVYICGLVLLVFIGLNASRSVIWLAETAHCVTHAEQVLGAINRVSAEAAIAQTHTRGYVITGDERYLKSLQAATARCREENAALRRLIADPAQRARSVRLEAQVNEVLQWFPRVIKARRTGVAVAAQRDLVNHGENLMDNLRALIEQMVNDERRLIQKRQLESESVARFTHVIISTGTVISLIVFLSVLLGLNHAVTERQQAAEALGTSGVRYRRLFEAARDGILILDAETGMVVDVNPFLVELLGYTREVFLGKKVWELGFFKDIVANQTHFAELQQKECIRYEDKPLETSDGRRIEVEFVSYVYQVNHQKVIQCNIRDITERKRAEETLSASEVRYRRFFEAARDGVLILDAETGMVVDVNPFLVELLGYSRDVFLGKKLWELGFFKDIVANQANFAELQQKEYIRYEDKPLETSDGRRIEVEFVSNVYQVNHQKVIQCNIRDITARKRAEEQLRASFKEVGDLNTEIQNFYHTLSHELKTPLASAREFVSIVMDGLAGSLNKTQLDYLGIAKESCDQLRLYINDLLDVTRLETGKMSLEFQPLPLAALVERVVEMLAPAAAGKGVSLSCDCQPDLTAVPIDKQRILQVLINLTTNAIKFTPAGGYIRLSLSQAPADPECLQVDVRDTGRGIPQDQLDVIFNRRYQANYNAQSVESRSGLGLGLYICQELVNLHGGRIWVESEIGKGSTFSFVIPKQAMTKGAHVLIVDDDYAIREMLRRILEDQQFEVTTAEGGSEALQLMGQKTPDVVVLDLMMPGLDGPSTMKEIRKNWGLIPVIVHTGYPDGELIRQAMEASPFTLLAKPCPPQRFVETIRRICQTHETRFLKQDDKASQAPAAQCEGPARLHQLNS